METPYKNLKSGFLRGVASAFLLSLLCSCGFKPVYQQANHADGTATSEDLAAVEIYTPHNLNGQFFQTTLTDLLNPTLDVCKTGPHTFVAVLNR